MNRIHLCLCFLLLTGAVALTAADYQNFTYAAVVPIDPNAARPDATTLWQGTVTVPQPGAYHLYLDANAPERTTVALTIDGAATPTLELPIAGRDDATFRRLKLAAGVELTAGAHDIALHTTGAPAPTVRALLVEAVVQPHPWQLVWAEEFDGDGMPDRNTWRTEPGFLRGRELQYYTAWRPENMGVKDGILTITARRESWPNAFYDPNETADWRFMRPTGEFTSANLDTLGLAAWQYGRIDVRARVTAGVGPWPAAWTMGEEKTGWPDCAEIDIMEFFARSNNRVTNACHFRSHRTGEHEQAAKWDVKTADGSTIEGNFHTYSVVWDENRIVWFLDGVQTFEHVRTAGAPWPFDRPQYVILNLAMGGDGGGPVDPAIQETGYYVDFVRVYQ